MRQLATIQKISELRAIEGADKIQVAMMEGLGWECVVRQGEVVVGDLVVYIETDSRVPERNEFEFLRERHFKVKTIRLKKQVSQGLIIPLTILPKDIVPKQGMDVTEILGVVNYQKQLEDAQDQENINSSVPKSKILKHLMKYEAFRTIYFILNKVDKGWPEWVVHTDEYRVQVCAKLLMNNFDKNWYLSEKLDGSSGTFFTHKIYKWGIPRWEFGVCSRNIRLKKPDNSNYWKIAQKYNLEKKLKSLKKSIVIQGEVIGVGIQKNKYGLSDVDFYVFNVIENGKRYSLEKMLEFCMEMELKPVPVIETCFNPSLIDMGGTGEVREIVQAMVKLSIGKSQLKNIEREGIVCRLVNNPHISFKVINPEFLLKNDL